MFVRLQLLLSLGLVLPCLGCFGIRYHDPAMQTYEDLADTTIQLTISSEPCGIDCAPSQVVYAESGMGQPEDEMVASHQQVVPPRPRFLPAPTQPVFSDRPEYNPPQPMLKFVPVNGDAEALKKKSELDKVEKDAPGELPQGTQQIQPIKQGPGKLKLEDTSPKPLNGADEEIKDEKNSEPNNDSGVRTVQGGWRAKQS